MLSAIGSGLVSIISFAVFIGLPLVLGALLSPTFRKEGQEALFSFRDRFAVWGNRQRKRAKTYIQQRQEKSQAKKVEQKRKSAHPDAFAALALAFGSGDMNTFRALKDQYANDPAVQKFVTTLVNSQAEQAAVSAAANGDGGAAPPPTGRIVADAVSKADPIDVDDEIEKPGKVA